MPEPYADTARRAAAALATEVGPALPAHVEARLAGAPDETQRYVEPAVAIAFASLLVSAAQFAWTIYRDLKKDAREKDSEARAREAMARQLRIKLEVPPGLTTENRDRAISVVVEEVIETEKP